ncbi:MAG: GNAT family N-acetyltransferase [Flavobacteriales bacterium]
MLTLDLSALPVLPTERLVLRALRAEDAAAMFAMRSDPIVMELVRRPLATTIDDAHALIAKIQGIQAANEGAQWAITLRGNDTFIGLIGLWRIIKEHHRAELGYTLARAHWGKGIMSEAIQPVLDHGFKVFGCHSVEAITDPRNAASIRVLEKNGFVREGHFKENVFWNGVFTDSLVYSRLAPR